MAITINAPDKNVAFTQQFFSHISSNAQLMVNALVSAGAKVLVSFQTIVVTYDPPAANPIKFKTFVLPANSTAILKNQLPAHMQQPLVLSIQSFLYKTWEQLTYYKANGKLPVEDELLPTPEPYSFASFQKVDPTVKTPIEFDAGGAMKVLGENPSEPPVQNISKPGMSEFSSEAEALLIAKALLVKYPALSKLLGGPKTDGTGKVPMLPFPKDPVKLAKATMLDQQVFGTSSGSIYHVVAIGPRLRMAIRSAATSLSVRVEGPLNQVERQALIALNFTDNGSYLSSHLALNTIPAHRVLGCLFFHPDLAIDQHVDPKDVK